MEVQDLRKLIGARIARVRRAANLSQEQLGQAIGANKQTVSRWERGIRSPDGEYLRIITETCHCTADFLLGLSDVFEVKKHSD